MEKTFQMVQRYVLILICILNRKHERKRKEDLLCEFKLNVRQTFSILQLFCSQFQYNDSMSVCVKLFAKFVMHKLANYFTKCCIETLKTIISFLLLNFSQIWTSYARNVQIFLKGRTFIKFKKNQKKNHIYENIFL